MYQQKYPHLFTPIVLGNTLFRNRIFASPTGYCNVNGDGYVDEGAAAYYERKAKGGVASVGSFGANVDGELGRAAGHQIAADAPFLIHNLSRIAYDVKAYGAVASLELHHCGMYANRSFSFTSEGGNVGKGLAYAPVDTEVGGRIVPEMPLAIIERTIDKFAKAAALAKASGFGMVTVHAGHGWLLHQFMNPNLNKRKDEWGGPAIENRMRLTLEVLKAIRKEVGPGFPIEVRMSVSECFEGGYGVDEGVAIAKSLEGYVDLINASAGNHEVDEVFAVTHPSMYLPEGVLADFAAELKKHVKTPIAAIGALSDPALMEEIIASGKADVVEAARTFICDPDFVTKVRTGNEKDARKCLRCFECFSSTMTNGEMYCALNPRAGRELEDRFEIPAAAKPKKVLVIGGGIGGMEAALTAKKRGHEVIVCEKTDTLGGVLRCEGDVPFKKNLHYYLDQQSRFISEAGIRVDLNTTASEDYVRSIEPDVIIAALGSSPIKPRIPGIDGDNVVSAQDAYINAKSLGNRVLIIGAGLAGVELGIYLKGLGKDAQVVEGTDHINAGGNFIYMHGLRVQVQKSALQIDYNSLVKAIDGNTVTCTRDGADVTYEADTIVYAVGQAPRREDSIAFNLLAPEFYMIGDCVATRNIISATSEAYHVVRNIR
ncbi:MAG: NAD(P)/FAD-dependent oxidoreductase [Clostridiales Family XIII bacterium]|nr:NAD(P)/FAD-dependent oxidoreductase [Clostridiales Family XIII bacterium]